MSNRDEQIFRKLKREVKKDGGRTRRRDLKRQLEESPEDCTQDYDYEFGHRSSKPMNGMFQDPKRLSKQDLVEDENTAE